MSTAKKCALAERQVLVGRPSEIESIGIFEDRFITIGGGKPERQAVPARIGLAFNPVSLMATRAN
jgi:hypothetical protein